MNGDGVITANELGLFLSEKVTMDSDNQQTPQYGRMTTQEGEFIFINSVGQLGINSITDSKSKIMPVNIAIIDFEGIGIDIKEIRALTKRLTSKIIALDVYNVFDRSQLNKRLREQKYEYSGCATSSCAIDIGKLVGVKYIVVGSISKIGETYSIDSRMIDVESGESLISAEYSTQNSIDDVITNGVESISYQLCNMEVSAPPKPSFFERMYKNRGKILLACITLFLGWGLLPS